MDFRGLGVPISVSTYCTQAVDVIYKGNTEVFSSCILAPAEILRISSCALTLRGSREVPVPWWSCTQRDRRGDGWSHQQRKGRLGWRWRPPKNSPPKPATAPAHRGVKPQKWEMEEVAESINTPVRSTPARRSSLSLPQALAERYLIFPSWRCPSHCIPHTPWHGATG